MLFSEEDAPLLKKWIVKRLENTYGSSKDKLQIVCLLTQLLYTDQMQTLMYSQTMSWLYSDMTATSKLCDSCARLKFPIF
jgi:hypothetical protein